MNIIDSYISEACSALASEDPVEIDRVAREIISAFRSEIPFLSPVRVDQLMSSKPHQYSSKELNEIIAKLCSHREKKDRELYGPYGLETMTEHIHELENALVTGIEGDDLQALYHRIDEVYANYYDQYVSGLCGWNYLDENPCDEQTRLRIEKLKHFRDAELRKARSAEARVANFNISAMSESVSSSSANIELSIAIEQIDCLPESSLTEEEKTALKGMMADLQTRDAKKREGNLQKLLKWLATKGTDVFIAAMPYVVQVIQSQM